MDQGAQRLAGRVVAPDGFGACQKIGRRAHGGDELRHDLILLGHLDLLASGEPARNLGPLFRHLLNTGGFHGFTVPCAALRLKTGVAARPKRTRPRAEPDLVGQEATRQQRLQFVNTRISHAGAGRLAEEQADGLGLQNLHERLTPNYSEKSLEEKGRWCFNLP